MNTLRCYYCNEPWVLHKGRPVSAGGLLIVQERPGCDCYGEHTGKLYAMLQGGGVLTVTGLRDEHRPPRTAQAQRAIDDQMVIRLQEAAAAAQAAVDQAVAQKRADQFAALAAALRGVLVAAGQPVPAELDAVLKGEAV